MKVLCVGGGPAGLYLSILLADAGHDVTLAERNPAGVTHGWGVGSSELLEPLAGGDPETARRIAEAVTLWHGQVVDHPDGRVAWSDSTGYTIGRHRLLDVLTERAREVGVRVEHSREIDVTTASDGHDLVVAADGVNSRFRERHAEALGTESRLGRNHYVWLGTTKFFEPFTFGFVRSAAGWLWTHAYGYAPDRSTFIVECPPETWRGLGLDALGAKESLALLEELFATQLEGHPLMVQGRDADTDVVPWLHYRAVRNEHWHVGRVALLGDAAHTTHFSIGSGTRLALEDAVTLADVLARHGGGADGVPAALAEYESLRRAAIQLAQRDAALSARWLEDVHRYADLGADRFAALFHWRRSPFLAQMPPRAYHRLRTAVEDSQALHAAWRRVNTFRRGRYVQRRIR